MQTFDIPINIKVSAETEEEAERLVSAHMVHLLDGPVLTRQVISWDFIEFVTEEEYEEASKL